MKSLTKVPAMIITVAYLLLLTAGLLLSSARWPAWTQVLLALLPTLLTIMWALGALRLTTSGALLTAVMMRACAASLLLLALPLWVAIGLQSMATSTEIDVISLVVVTVVVVTYVAIAWGAAEGLVRSEQNVAEVPWHLTVGSFLLVVYLPVGVWFLRDRVLRIE